jgi:leader peptidase (prepilin peptidase)/N-methyltransferase
MELARNVARLYQDVAQTPLGPVFAFILGSIVGSFLNVVIVRLPEGQSIVRPRSRCPQCGDAIPWYLNIPILSWLYLRGRCRACKTPISIRYPIVELITATLFLASLVTFGLSLAFLATVIMASGLVAITFIDIDIWEIPDEISIPGMVIGSLLRPFAFGAPWWDGLAGALIGACALALVRWGHAAIRWILRQEYMEGMGLGDLKLLAMIGAFIGVKGLLPCVLVASAAGSIIGVIVLIANRNKPPPPPPTDPDEWVPPARAVPFGPFLALGGIAQILFGGALASAFYRVMDRLLGLG